MNISPPQAKIFLTFNHDFLYKACGRGFMSNSKDASDIYVAVSATLKKCKVSSIELLDESQNQRI
jgi:hypothetical protein